MKLFQILIFVGFAIISSSVSAGVVQPYVPVEVNLSSRYATGNMLAARNSKNDVEHIGCAVSVKADGHINGLCNASDPDGVSIRCLFYDNEILTRAVYGISDYSFVAFGWDENEDCTSIRVSHRSFYLPKE